MERAEDGAQGADPREVDVQGAASGSSEAGAQGAASGSSEAGARPGRVWTVQEAQRWTQEYLERHGDCHARLSAEYLLSDATGLSRIQVYAFFDRPLSSEERARLRETVARRATGEPLQYACGVAPFRHLEIPVAPGVLIPRPETEVLVDRALELLDEAHAAGGGAGEWHEAASCGDCGEAGELLVVEPCTGSGCIAAALVTERSGIRVIATDNSPEALAGARATVEALSLNGHVELVADDGCGAVLARLAAAGRVPALLISNPPYVPAGTLPALPAEVREHEPLAALDGGDDGLNVVRLLLAQIAAARAQGLSFPVLFELDERNVVQGAQLIRDTKLFPHIRTFPDLTGRVRFLEGRPS